VKCTKDYKQKDLKIQPVAKKMFLRPYENGCGLIHQKTKWFLKYYSSI